MTDYKSYGVLDYTKVTRNSSIKQIAKCRNLAPEEVAKQLTYNQNEILEVKNFLRYKIASKLNLYTVNRFDCDSIQEVVKSLCRDLQSHAHCQICDCTISGNRITFNAEGKNVVLQTDTRLSMQTLFGQYMRLVLRTIEPDWINQYYSAYGIPKHIHPCNLNPCFRDYYFLENLDNWYDKLDEYQQQCLKNFNLLSKLIHCEKNFVLVPDGFNTKRYALTNDFPELTLLVLQQMTLDRKWPNYSYQWYCRHIDCFGWAIWTHQHAGQLENWNIDLDYFFNRDGITCKRKMPENLNECIEKFIKVIDPQTQIC